MWYVKKMRKRHVQLELREPVLDKNKQHRGGRREGAGRPKITGRRASERHKARPELTGREPLLVTVRIDQEVGNLRRKGTYHALRFALYTAAAVPEEFRIVHFSIQRTHLHMIVEARSKAALSRGMKGLLISAAKHINGELTVGDKRRKGRVVSDRYHASVLRTPRQVRNAINYVLNNWRRHQEHLAPVAQDWLLDPFSSAVNFGGWKELEGKPFLFNVRESYQRLMTCFPQTWLLREGWERWGRIGAREVPGRVR